VVPAVLELQEKMVEFAVPRTRSRRSTLHHPPRQRSIRDSTEPLSPALPASGARWAGSYRVKLRLTDASIITASVAATFALQLSAATDVLGLTLMSLIVLGVWSGSLSAFRSRDPRVIGVGASEYKRVLNASTTALGLLAVAFVVFQADAARWFVTLTFPAGLLGLLLSRWIWRQWLITQRASGHFLSRVIVIGGRRDVEKVVRQMRASSGAAYLVVGAVVEEGQSSLPGGPLGDLVVLSDLTRTAEFARTLGVDGVVVAGQPSGDGDFIHDLAWELEGSTAELILATSLANIAGPRIHFRPVDGLPLIHVEIPQFDGGKHVAKRAMDVAISAIALLFLAPAFAAIALLVKLDSDGPAFFAQERVGRGGTVFRILKFRSMNTAAPQQLDAVAEHSDGNGVLFKLKNDPRVTRLGRVLRKYSLDELPQLWNVLLGDMSLVGPRPPLPVEVRAYEDHVHRRLFIKPGLTGMWQVGGRSNLSWEDSVRLDLYYVENWSLVGDIIILWRTVKVVAQPVGAY
jgi:exopolysaccharide biosynthesis polyprenyl glycosylphosphotransferase